MATSSHLVVLLGVARTQDKCILGCFFPRIPAKRQNAYMQMFKEGIELARPVGSLRVKNDFKDARLFVQVDPTAAFAFGAIVTDKNYPDRVAYQMLTEFQNVFKTADVEKLGSAGARSLERQFKSAARGLILKYSDAASYDPTAQVMMKVESVKVIVDQNIKKVLENHGNLEDLATKTDNLSASANQFNKNATAVKNATWRQKVALSAALGVLLACIVGYIIYVLVELFT